MQRAPARPRAGQKDRCLPVVADCSADRQGRDCAHCLTAAKEAQLSLFITLSPSGVAMFDRKMRYLATSRRWRSVFRLEGDVVGRSHDDVFPEAPAHWKDRHRRAQAGETVTEDRELFVRADGTEQWLRWELHPWRRPDGSIRGLVAYVEDITDHVIDQERLRQSEAQLRALGDSLPDSAIFQYEPDKNGETAISLLQRRPRKDHRPRC